MDGTSVTPFKHDSTTTSLPVEVIIGTGQTVTATDILNISLISTDEPAINTITIDETQTFYTLSHIWTLGYADGNSPLVLREGEGVAVIHSGNIAVGVYDFFILFTAE